MFLFRSHSNIKYVSKILNVITLYTETHLHTGPSLQADFSCKLFQVRTLQLLDWSIYSEVCVVVRCLVLVTVNMS